MVFASNGDAQMSNRLRVVLLTAALAAVVTWLVYSNFYRPDFAAPGDVRDTAPQLP